jgi:hypothetical protein
MEIEASWISGKEQRSAARAHPGKLLSEPDEDEDEG